MKITIIPISFVIVLSLLLFPFTKVHDTSFQEVNYSAKQLRIEENKLKDNPYSIIISKKTYELKVYDDLGWFATYPCVFGSNDLGDKFMEGDKKTPEGKSNDKIDGFTPELRKEISRS